MKTAIHISISQWVFIITTTCFLILAAPLWANESASEHPHSEEAAGFNLESMDKPADQEMAMGHHAFAHPFLAHMGIPDGPGELSIRASAIQMAEDSMVSHDMALHIEAGLWKRLGLHIRDDAVKMGGAAELMLQYAVLQNKHGDSGISAFLELEFPAGYVPEDEYEPEVEFGISGRKIFGTYGIIDGGVHYAPQESMVAFEASGILRLTPTIFPIVEGYVEREEDETMATLLTAIKIKMRQGAYIGTGMQFALTDYRHFDNQAIVQLDIAY